MIINRILFILDSLVTYSLPHTTKLSNKMKHSLNYQQNYTIRRGASQFGTQYLYKHHISSNVPKTKILTLKTQKFTVQSNYVHHYLKNSYTVLYHQLRCEKPINWWLYTLITTKAKKLIIKMKHNHICKYHFQESFPRIIYI